MEGIKGDNFHIWILVQKIKTVSRIQGKKRSSFPLCLSASVAKNQP